MGDEPPGHRRRPAAALAVLVAVIATVGGFIAILQRPTTHEPTRPSPIQTPAPTAAEAPPDLSGTWEGECTGPFNAFCSLTLTQTVDALDGTVIVSSPQDHLHINGALTGRAISFGAVGVVSFTGTLAGSTMSGSYTDIANGKTGSWSVTLFP